MRIKKWLQPARDYLKDRYMLFVLTGWLVLFMETISRNATLGAVSWGILHIPAFLLNGAFLFLAMLILTAVTGRTRLSYWIVSFIGFVLALISGIKSKMLGVPLLPWDFVLTGEAADMAQYLKNVLSLRLVVELALFVSVSWLALYRTSRLIKVIRWKERVVAVAAAVIFTSVLYWDKPLPVKAAFGISPIPWDQSEHIGTNGLLLATMLNLDYMKVDKMEDYNETAISDIKSATSHPKPVPDVKPNVIVVLSESLWDPTQLKSVRFSEDPLSFIHELQKSTAAGTLLSPQFGGGTANVEFEVLTGNTMRFLPEGTIPYNQHINRGVDSLASIFARQGYYATAISPFHRWYFNGDKVYRNFGFRQFIPLEYFDPVYSGPYIADDEVAKMIIRQTQTTSDRDFVFANTMENHFHYYPGKFPENTIQAAGKLSEESRGMLETYAQGAKHADQMLKTLVEHYKQSDEPTMIVFFGDHLPFLGDDYKVYKEAGWISGSSDPDFLNKMYRTPLVVWSNYLPEHKETLHMSPQFLGPYILEKANMPGNYYTDFLSELYKKQPVLPPKNLYGRFNIDWPATRKYELLQYDAIFGEQFAYGEIKDRIVSPDYFVGFGPMELEQISYRALEGNTGPIEIVVEGRNIPALAKIHVNGKMYKTEQDPDGTFTATIPAGAFKSGTANIQMKVYDSKQIAIGESNTKPLSVSIK